MTFELATRLFGLVRRRRLGEEDALRLVVRQAFNGPRPEDLAVTFPLDNDASFRVILLDYPFSLLIPGLRDTFNLTISRRVPIG